jgi:hypothetical protein
MIKENPIWQAGERGSGGTLRVASFSILCVLLLFTLPSCCSNRRDPDTSPPDLSGCTRIVTHYPFGGLNYFVPAGWDDILNDEEKQYLRSLETWAVDDSKLIKEFARDVSRGVYAYQSEAVIPARIGVTCYRGSDLLISLQVADETVRVGDGRYFNYPKGLPNLTILEPPGALPFKWRWWCESRVYSLFYRGLMRRPADLLYPDPNRWCDMIVEILRSQYFKDATRGIEKTRSFPDVAIARMFTCPSPRKLATVDESRLLPADANLPNKTVHEWKSDYALNPSCQRDSPPDMVLLFEARPGWNEYGGLELFTFDNHDPKGGLVLLHDGTVKFIRTEEELKQLRWK